MHAYPNKLDLKKEARIPTPHLYTSRVLGEQRRRALAKCTFMFVSTKKMHLSFAPHMHAHSVSHPPTHHQAIWIAESLIAHFGCARIPNHRLWRARVSGKGEGLTLQGKCPLCVSHKIASAGRFLQSDCSGPQSTHTHARTPAMGDATTTRMPPTGLFIDGLWTDAASGLTFAAHDPRTGATVALMQ
jgi:hypothetical protein